MTPSLERVSADRAKEAIPSIPCVPTGVCHYRDYNGNQTVPANVVPPEAGYIVAWSKYV